MTSFAKKSISLSDSTLYLKVEAVNKKSQADIER